MWSLLISRAFLYLATPSTLSSSCTLDTCFTFLQRFGTMSVPWTQVSLSASGGGDGATSTTVDTVSLSRPSLCVHCFCATLCWQVFELVHIFLISTVSKNTIAHIKHYWCMLTEEGEDVDCILCGQCRHNMQQVAKLGQYVPRSLLYLVRWWRCIMLEVLQRKCS